MAITPEQAEQIRKRLLEQIEKLPADQRGQLKDQIMNATPEQLESALGGNPGDPNDPTKCLFCGIGSGDIETFKIYEDENMLAFLDINPSAVGQVIVMPKEHYQFIFQVPDQILWALFKVVKMIEPLIVNATKSGGVSIYIGQGNAAGQNVKHLSINIIPRFENDKAAFYWQRNEAKEEDLEKMTKALKDGLDKMIKEERMKIEKALKEKQDKQKPQKVERVQELGRRTP